MVETASRPSGANWQSIQDTIKREDPLCRGVLLLGLAASEAELVACFAAAAPFEIVKGFAIGRTIFHDAARLGFRGSMSDGEAIEAMTNKLSALASAWLGARAAVAA